MNQSLLKRRYSVWRLLVCTATIASLTACDSHPVRPGMTEEDVFRLMGKPTLSFADKKQFVAFFDDNKECREKSVKLMIYDRSWRKDVIVGINVGGMVQCVDMVEGVAVTDFHTGKR